MLLASASLAQAAVQVLPSQSFALYYSSITAGTVAQVLDFNLFNIGGATLTGVSIALADAATATATAGIIGGQPDDADSMAVTATFNAAVGLLAVAAGTGAANAYCMVATGSECFIETTNPAMFSLPNPFARTSPADDLSAFSGAGQFALAISIDDIVLMPFFDNMSGLAFPTDSIALAWSGDVTVTYTYDAPTTDTPEPASLALLASGIGLAALSRRRRPGPSAV